MCALNVNMSSLYMYIANSSWNNVTIKTTRTNTKHTYVKTQTDTIGDINTWEDDCHIHLLLKTLRNPG